MHPDRPATSQALPKALAKIDIMQKKYFKDNKEYWQGLKTMTDSTKKAGSQPSWKDQKISLTGMTENISVHTYDGPNGKGYVVIIEIEVEGGTYQMKRANGAEKWREHSWTFTPDDDGITR